MIASQLVRRYARNFRWEDLNGLVPRGQHQDRAKICDRVRTRFAALAYVTEGEARLLEDQTAHRESSLFKRLRAEACLMAEGVVRP